MSKVEDKIKELEYRIGELEEEIFGKRQETGKPLTQKPTPKAATNVKEKDAKRRVK